MRLALIGLTGAGKSTLMRVIAGHQISSKKKYNQIVQVILPIPDPRLNKLSAILTPKKTIYSNLTYLNPPILTNRLKNQTFIIPTVIRQCEGLIEVIRNFYTSLESPPMPINDHKIVSEELILNDLITIEHRLEHILYNQHKYNKVDQEELDLCKWAKNILSEGKPLRTEKVFTTNPKIKGFSLLSAKPLISISNNNENNIEVPYLNKKKHPIIIQADIEAKLTTLTNNERTEIITSFRISRLAINRLIQATYQALNLITFFTVGRNEVRAWTIWRNTSTKQAAGLIHSDLQKGFIRAEIIHYKDLIRHGSETTVKKAGLMKSVKHNYPINDGDILHIHSNIKN